MNFKYFSKTIDRSRGTDKKIGEKDAQKFMNKQFNQLADKHLTLAITLYNL